jgi:hypothetical protein
MTTNRNETLKLKRGKPMPTKGKTALEKVLGIHVQDTKSVPDRLI